MIESNDKVWCVYMHINKINDKKYIGITSKHPEQRWKNGSNYRKDSQPVFYRAIQKYTWDGFHHIIIATGLNENEAKQMEVELIALYKTNCCRYNNPDFGYNMTDGGDGSAGHILSDETKEKIREKQLKRFENPAERDRQSKLAKERFTIPENVPMRGRHHSDETKKIISNKVKLALANEDIRKMLSNMKKGLYDGDKNPQYGSGETVVQLTLSGDFVAEYISGFDAYLKTGINYASIYRCCVGDQLTSGGFIWMHKKDYGIKEIQSIKIKKKKTPISIVQISLNGDFVSIYNSITEASNITGIDRGGINKCCLNRARSAGGYKWMYKEDWDKLQLTI